ncbi:MAG TPA: M15 family metallopeptidase [Candidatus Kapabacteria bacterium]|nr:M15 family metallopeptidase [Candidatus Kapabacteria bacterium]HPO62163.1 M15 family metallopeptidase [Candidatus Kapabacteria bacterium]
MKKKLTQIKYYTLWQTLFVLLLLSCSSSTSSNSNNPYGLDLVDNISKYKESISKNADMELIDLEIAIPSIKLDIRYATKNNFTGEIIYTSAKAFARKPVAIALKKVQDSLAKHNLGLRVYDAYRPYSATLKFYEVYPDTNFVANPKYGSRHNRGCAIDLTLIDLNTGKEIPMPSEFDEFSEKAHPDYMNLSPEIIKNRTFLFNIMSHFGLTHYPTEWWHFDYTGWESYKLMNLSFEELMKM